MNKVICINNQDHPLTLSFGKIYTIYYDDDEVAEGFVRIKDDKENVYTYPMKYFREYKENTCT